MTLWARWWKFTAVGAMGMVVQLGVLAALRGGAGLHYMAATALAVEFAVLHNFAWHESWTWRDRRRAGAGIAPRLLRFHISNGAISLAVNLLLMGLLAGGLHVPYLAANVVAIAAGALANFAAANCFVFATCCSVQTDGCPPVTLNPVRSRTGGAQ